MCKIYASPAVLRRWQGVLRAPTPDNVIAGEMPSGIHQRIIDARQFSENGVFRSLLSLPVPHILSYIMQDKRIISYALCTPMNEKLFGYAPERIGAQCFGLIGAWTDPQFRNHGHARGAVQALGSVLGKLPHDKFYVLTELRMLWMQEIFPLVMLPRWSYQQPPREATISMLRN